MAAQTVTYANLLLDIEAAAGDHGGYATAELASIKRLINQRARKAYRESPMWERWLIIGEERAVDNSATGHAIVPYTGAVYDATTADQQNPYDGTIDEAYRIHQKVPWDTVSAIEYQFQGHPDGLRLQNYAASYGLSKTVDSATAVAGTVTIELQANVRADYYAGGTIRLAEFATSPADINGTHTLTSVNAASYLAGRTQVQFTLAGASGTWTLAGDETAEAPTAFVTYKQRLDIIYGDGASETSTVPLEWASYIAFGVAADLKRGERQFGDARELEAVAMDRLQDELCRLDAQHSAETIFKRHRTHLSEGRMSITVS